jgi:hypothetical protein
MSCLKLYLSHIPLLAFFFSWLNDPSGHRPPQLQGFVIMLRCGLLRQGLHRATLNASCQFTLLKSLVTKPQSQGVKLKSVQLYWLLAG